MVRSILMAALVISMFVVFPSRTVHSAECVFSPEEEQRVAAAYARLRERRVMQGGPGELDPTTLYGTMTRAEYSVTLVFALGWDLATPTSEQPLPFSDIARHWASPAISLLYRAGVVSGYGDGTFHPDEKITLAHAKIMLARLLRAAPLVTTENVDASLNKVGIKTETLPCSSGQQNLLRGQEIFLLDKALSTSLYLRNR